MHEHPSGNATTHRLDQAAQSAEQAIAATRRRVNEAIDGLADSVEGLRGSAAPAFGRMADEAGALARGSVDAVRDGSQRLLERARRSGGDTVDYIRHEPVKSVLIAAATGAALMALVQLVVDRRGRD